MTDPVDDPPNAEPRGRRDENPTDRLESSAPAAVRTSLGSLAPGAVLAERFRIVRFLAEGGMGEVYEAEDLELSGRLALKTIRPGIAHDARSLERFRREIQLARRVTHPNVSRVFDVFRHKDGGKAISFLTMELLEGETLARRIYERGA